MLLLGLSLLLGCMEAPHKRAGQSRPAGDSTAEQKPAEQKGAAEQPVAVRQTAFAQRPAPAAREPEVPALDPSLVPVEEDFRAEAERRIDKRSNLEQELERVAREIAKRQ
jgi:hypothetical protein